MATPVVTNTAKRPDQSPAPDAVVSIELVGEAGKRLAGFVSASDYTLYGLYKPTVNSTTAVWAQALVPNSLIVPAGTMYKITTRIDGGVSIDYVTVTNVAGPLFVEDIIEDGPPGPLAGNALLQEIARATAAEGVIAAGLSAHIADGTDAHDASAISSVPAGTLAATDVQTALNELDSEKATTGSVSTVAGDLAAHIADATDAHDASAISYAGSANITAVTVEAAIDELDTEALHKAGTETATGDKTFNGDVLIGAPNLPSPIDTDIPFQVGASKMLLANLSSELPTFVEIVRTGTGGEVHARGSVGLLGAGGATGEPSAAVEMNMTVNMDYTTGEHRYYDPTVAMIWTYLGNSVLFPGFGLQYVKAGHPQTPDPWYLFGKEVFKVLVLPNTGDGEAVEGGSRVTCQEVDLVDGLYGGGAPARFKAENQVAGQLPAVSLSSWWDDLMIQKVQSGGAAPVLHLRKQLTPGVWNMGAAGIVTGQIESQGAVASINFESTATVHSGFSNLEIYFKTTATAGGAAAERVRITQDGWLFVKNGAAVPGSNPVDGIFLFAQGGALKCRGESGTVTTLGPA